MKNVRTVLAFVLAVAVLGLWWWVERDADPAASGRAEPTASATTTSPTAASPSAASPSSGAPTASTQKTASATPSTTTPSAAPATSRTAPPTTAAPSPRESRDPLSGLAWVEESDLPSEALDTLALIDEGGPFPYDEDDGTFGNFEGVLPDHARGYYREYTVDTPGARTRGARRIVTGDGGEYYYTGDHYQSFERIRR